MIPLPHVQGIFAQIIGSHVQSIAASHRIQVQAYIDLLKSHDWECGDIGELNMIQKSIDRDCVIWNEFCPVKFKK